MKTFRMCGLVAAVRHVAWRWLNGCTHLVLASGVPALFDVSRLLANDLPVISEHISL